jgi:hypothetical protein
VSARSVGAPEFPTPEAQTFLDAVTHVIRAQRKSSIAAGPYVTTAWHGAASFGSMTTIVLALQAAMTKQRQSDRASSTSTSCSIASARQMRLGRFTNAFTK